MKNFNTLLTLLLVLTDLNIVMTWTGFPEMQIQQQFDIYHCTHLKQEALQEVNSSS